MHRQAGSTAATGAISRRDSKEARAMTREQFDRELRFQAAIFVARTMRAQEVITACHYAEIQTRFTAKYCPVFAGLYDKMGFPSTTEKGTLSEGRRDNHG
jgi:hypothetical protein